MRTALFAWCTTTYSVATYLLVIHRESKNRTLNFFPYLLQELTDLQSSFATDSFVNFQQTYV